ncbi:MAG: hypothetical protein MPL62_12905, partial [Alphaproteobacteria bacterium]|nr:hypothetical protein [Alphaproteobacteria bacterium]
TFSGQSVEILPQTFTLDVDDSGSVNAGDGIMIIRYIARLRGASLTRRQTAADPAEVATAIAAGVDSQILDVDGSGAVNAGDGIMIVRYIARLRGASLTRRQSNADPAVVAANIAALL